MKVVLRGTCSECYQTTELLLTDKTKEIVCPTCGHAVPALESKAMKAISKDQGKRRMLSIVAFVLFLLAAVLFVLFIRAAEPGEVGKAFVTLPGPAKGMLGGAILALLLSMGVGFVASSRDYVCEF